MSQATRVNQKVKKHIRNTQNKPCRGELVTSRNRNFSHIRAGIVLYTIENSPMDFSRESQTSRNDTESAWIIVEGSRSRKLGFPNICNLFHRFSKLINITIICSPIFLIHFFWYFGKRRRFLPPSDCTFLTSSIHVSLETVFNQYKIMSKNELKFAQK